METPEKKTKWENHCSSKIYNLYYQHIWNFYNQQVKYTQPGKLKTSTKSTRNPTARQCFSAQLYDPLSAVRPAVWIPYGCWHQQYRSLWSVWKLYGALVAFHTAPLTCDLYGLAQSRWSYRATAPTNFSIKSSIWLLSSWIISVYVSSPPNILLSLFAKRKT